MSRFGEVIQDKEEENLKKVANRQLASLAQCFQAHLGRLLLKRFRALACQEGGRYRDNLTFAIVSGLIVYVSACVSVGA